MDNEKVARALVSERIDQETQGATQASQRQPISLEEFFNQVQKSGDQTLRLVLKADVQGSLEPIVSSLKGLSYDKLKVKLLLEGTGNISESDINLAAASGAIVLGFNVDIDQGARRVIESEGVDVRHYQVIYKLIDDIDRALKGMLEPVYEDKVIGQAEVRAVFKTGRRSQVAGSYIRDGQIVRNGLARVIRNSEVLHTSKVASLKRFTEDVKEVATGFECGIGIDGFNDFKEGDIIEAYIKERVN
jgi:translation initiation factor IF-2